MKRSENWASIEGFEGIYEVSDLGRIRSLDRVMIRKASQRMGECYFFAKGTIKSQRKSKKCQYLSVDIHNKRGNTKTRMVHRIVANAFVPNPFKKPCVNHKDGNKLNNRADNLEWVTYKENSEHAIRMGLIKRRKRIFNQ